MQHKECIEQNNYDAFFFVNNIFFVLFGLT